MTIGKNIAKYRRTLKLTQEELGNQLGVSNQAVSKRESDVSMPDVMLLPNIAKTLHITLEELYGIPVTHKENRVSADEFPNFCHNKLIDTFYYHAGIKFTCTGLSDDELIDIFLSVGIHANMSDNIGSKRLYISMAERRSQGLFRLDHEFNNNFLCPRVAKRRNVEE